ncbi:hypothetical protein [Hyalangium gracile]|uniref:hypothetical protein n=1 Tax=Hyalangium gracile TaxID=394092 RepID=UPI001CCF09AD|nr:hypothetical protein [Hyalangium gracile]
MLSRCALVLLLAGSAAAAEPRAEARWGLRWSAPDPGCIQAAPLARAVEARLGRTVFGPEPEFLIDGVLRRGQPSGWMAALTLVDGTGRVLGSREVSTPEDACAAIEPRVVLVLSLMIDPAALSSAVPQASATPEFPRAPEVEESAPLALTEEPAPVVVERPPPSRTQIVLTTAATGSTGLGLNAAAGVSGAVWFRPREWAGLVRIGIYPYSAFEEAGGRVVLSSASLEAGVCPLVGAGGAWRVSGCATVMVSSVLAVNNGFPQDRAELLGRGDGGLRVQLERRIGKTVALHASLGAAMGWFRPTVRLLHPDGSVEDFPLGLPLHLTLDLGVSWLES